MSPQASCRRSPPVSLWTGCRGTRTLSAGIFSRPSACSWSYPAAPSSAALGLPDSDAGPALAWCAAQKVGAAAAVAIGVRRRVLSRAALGVAAFDFASGLLILDYRRRMTR